MTTSSLTGVCMYAHVCVSLLVYYPVFTMNCSTRYFAIIIVRLQCEGWIWNKLCAVFWKEIFPCNSVFIKETRRILLKCVLIQIYGMKKTARSPSDELSYPSSQSNSTSVIHKSTAPTSTLRKLPFLFWSFPSFIICSLQCKTGKSKQCLWSASYDHICSVYPWESMKRKELTTCRVHHSISVSAKEEARCNLFYSRPSFPSEPQRAIDIQPPTPAFSPTSKFRHHMLGRWLSATQFKQGLEPPLLLACVFINISRLSMGPEIPGNWEQFGLCYLKWLHFL